MKRSVSKLLAGGLFSAVLAFALFTKPAFAQFVNPIQAAKDAYNKAKAQQQAQKPATPAAKPNQPAAARSAAAASGPAAGIPDRLPRLLGP